MRIIALLISIFLLLNVYASDTSKINLNAHLPQQEIQSTNFIVRGVYSLENQILLHRFAIKNQSSCDFATSLISNQLSFKEENYLFMTIHPKDEWWLFKGLDAEAKAFRDKTGFNLGSGPMSRNYFMFYKNFVPSIYHYRSMERRLINPTLRPRYDAEQ